MFGRAGSEAGAAFRAGCKPAIFARGVTLEFAAACLTTRAFAAGFDLSPRIAGALRATAFDERYADCAGAACIDIDVALRDQAM